MFRHKHLWFQVAISLFVFTVCLSVSCHAAIALARPSLSSPTTPGSTTTASSHTSSRALIVSQPELSVSPDLLKAASPSDSDTAQLVRSLQEKASTATISQSTKDKVKSKGASSGKSSPPRHPAVRPQPSKVKANPKPVSKSVPPPPTSPTVPTPQQPLGPAVTSLIRPLPQSVIEIMSTISQTVSDGPLNARIASQQLPPDAVLLGSENTSSATHSDLATLTTTLTTTAVTSSSTADQANITDDLAASYSSALSKAVPNFSKKRRRYIRRRVASTTAIGKAQTKTQTQGKATIVSKSDAESKTRNEKKRDFVATIRQKSLERIHSILTDDQSTKADIDQAIQELRIQGREQLLQSVRHSNGRVRSAVLRELGAQGDVTDIGLLVETVLSDDYVESRQAATDAILSIAKGDTTLLSKVTRTLKQVFDKIQEVKAEDSTAPTTANQKSEKVSASSSETPTTVPERILWNAAQALLTIHPVTANKVTPEVLADTPQLLTEKGQNVQETAPINGQEATDANATAVVPDTSDTTNPKEAPLPSSTVPLEALDVVLTDMRIVDEEQLAIEGLRSINSAANALIDAMPTKEAIEVASGEEVKNLKLIKRLKTERKRLLSILQRMAEVTVPFTTHPFPHIIKFSLVALNSLAKKNALACRVVNAASKHPVQTVATFAEALLRGEQPDPSKTETPPIVRDEAPSQQPNRPAKESDKNTSQELPTSGLSSPESLPVLLGRKPTSILPARSKGKTTTVSTRGMIAPLQHSMKRDEL